MRSATSDFAIWFALPLQNLQLLHAVLSLESLSLVDSLCALLKVVLCRCTLLRVLASLVDARELVLWLVFLLLFLLGIITSLL